VPRWWAVALFVVSTGRAAAQEPAAVEVVDASAPAACSSRTWVQLDYLLWRIKNDAAPFPLLTTGPAGAAQPGVLGQPDTHIVVGNQLDYRLNSGVRLVVGRWLDDTQALGVELRGFCLETHTIHDGLDADRSGAPVIARPFFNLQTGQPAALVITSPQDPFGGQRFGGIDIFADSRTWGGEANCLLKLGESATCQWHGLAGFRFLAQKDQLRFSQSSTILVLGDLGFGGSPAPVPDIVSLRDYFETTNFFYGGQVGAEGTLRRGRWSLDFSGMIGLGATDQRQEIDGRTMLTDPTGFTQTIHGGLYATPDIVGHFEQVHFAWTSELNVCLGLELTPHCQFKLGYTFLYWDGVVRPGQQLPLGVDPRQVPSSLVFEGAQPARAAPFRTGDFWGQGLSLGLTFRF
jgi:putative beta barrel porin BBP7